VIALKTHLTSVYYFYKESQSVRRTDLGSGVKGMLLAGFGRGQSNETVISFGRETKA
jgi:L-asparaginase/Glu-tRNA(Gln) amidotransferase subunit D